LNPHRNSWDVVKIALLFNHSAGRRLSLGSLRSTLVREGHEIVRVIEHKAEAAHLADPPAELVVAAGGDGTVAAAARAVAGTNVPLAVLPFGTANNMAFTLGVSGPTERVAAGWHDAERRPLDLGTIHGEWGTRRFVEGAGVGLVEACMTSIKQRPVPSDEPPPWQLVRALRRYTETLARLAPAPWTMTLDGSRLEGEYLLVEVMNARAVGPNLELGPASPSDGLLTVVMAGEDHRHALATYITARLEGRECELVLPVATARRIEVFESDTWHVDDALVGASSQPVTIDIEPAAITVLMPRT
jgi:diacylglycerol kinase (ATP)